MNTQPSVPAIEMEERNIFLHISSFRNFKLMAKSFEIVHKTRQWQPHCCTPCKKGENIWETGTGVMDERDLASFELRLSFGGITVIATALIPQYDEASVNTLCYRLVQIVCHRGRTDFH